MTTRTVFIGTGEFAVPALRLLAASPNVDLRGVVTAPSRPAGRRAEARPSPVHAVATELGIATLTPARLRSPDAIAAVLAHKPDLIVLADYGQIVPAALLGVRQGALNLHPSLLPRHRGAVPIPATILAGDAMTGVTLMQMDAGLDTGPIVATDELALTGVETTQDLEHTLAARAANLLGRSLDAWVMGRLTPQPQPAEGATLTRQLRREDGRLDPGLTAELVERQVRAFQPWPGSWLDTSAGRLVVWAVRPWPDPGQVPAGSLRLAGNVPVLEASDGAVELLEVQPAGGRRMSGRDFARGRPAIDAKPAAGEPRPPIERAVGYSQLP